MPRVRALDDPTPCLSAHLADEGLFAAPPDVRSNSAAANRGSYVRVVVALVEAQVFGASRPRGPRMTTASSTSLIIAASGTFAPLISAAIGTPRAIGQYMAFYAAFRPVRRVRPREVPPFGAFIEALSRELHFQAMPRRQQLAMIAANTPSRTHF